MTLKQCYKNIGNRVFYGTFIEGCHIECYPVIIAGVTGKKVLIGQKYPVEPANIFLSEEAFLKTCLKIIKPVSKKHE